MLFWIIGGIALVSVAFFFSSDPIDPWPALNAAGIVAALYLIALLAFVMRKPFSMKARISTYGAFVVLGLFIYSAWSGMEEQSRWQRSQLLKIGSMIAKGIISSELHTTYLIPVFERHHQQEAQKKVPIGEVFRQMYPNAKVGDNIRTMVEEYDSTMVFLVELSNDRVTLVGQAAHFGGRDPFFENHSGRMGMVQARAVLTEKGVMYEQEN